MVESFFSTLRSELSEDAERATRETAQLALFEWIELWYNRERCHWSGPMHYEQAMLETAT